MAVATAHGVVNRSRIRPCFRDVEELTHASCIMICAAVWRSRGQTCQVSRISRESHAFSLNSRFSARLNIISRILFYLSYALISQEN